VAHALTVTLAACGSSAGSPESNEICEGFGDWQTSPYILPYAVGASYFVHPTRAPEDWTADAPALAYESRICNRPAIPVSRLTISDPKYLIRCEVRGLQAR
jgi:hypothetical protein